MNYNRLYYNSLQRSSLTPPSYILGKAVLLGSVLCVSYYYGKVAGILSAAVAILLLHKSLEGLENSSSNSETEETTTDTTASPKDDEETSNDGEGKPKEVVTHEDIVIDETITTSASGTEDDDAEVKQEKAAAALSTHERVTQEEKMRPTKANNEDTTEAFTIYGGALQNDPMALYSSVENFATFQ